MSTTKIKKQHYVPRFYLKSFSGSNDKVFVFDKNKLKNFYANISDIGHANGFYALKKELIAPQSLEIIEQEGEIDYHNIIENILSDYDDANAKAIQDVIKVIDCNLLLQKKFPTNIYLNEQLKFQLAFFLSIQDSRTTEARERLLQTTHFLIDQTSQFLLKNNSELTESMPKGHNANDIQVEINKEVGSLYQGRILADTDHFQRLAIALSKKMIWRIGINITNKPLIISDNPIGKNNFWHQPMYRTLGLLSPGIELSLPLNSKYVLSISCKSNYKMPYGQEKSVDSLTFKINNEGLDYYNFLQISQSYRFLYCEKNDWLFTKKVLQENTAYQNPFRLRINHSSGRGLPTNWNKNQF